MERPRIYGNDLMKAVVFNGEIIKSSRIFMRRNSCAGWVHHGCQGGDEKTPASRGWGASGRCNVYGRQVLEGPIRDRKAGGTSGEGSSWT